MKAQDCKLAGWSETLQKSAYRVVVLSEEAPDNLSPTGADIDGMPDDGVIAEGSVLVTANGNYVAFEDGTFVKKNS